MIEAKDLRIGNWVNNIPNYYLIAGQYKVKQIKERGLILSTYGKCITYSAIEGIPLTEEWLLKFGAEKKYEHDEDIWRYKIKLPTGILDNYEFSYLDIWLYSKIRCFLTGGYNHETDNHLNDKHTLELNCLFVHQLQNLYFALTGNDLAHQQYPSNSA